MTHEKIVTLKYLSVLLALMLFAGCGGDNEVGNTGNDKAISVKGQVVSRSSTELKKSFTGTLEGVRHAVLTAKIAEAVERVNVNEGDFVQADDVLVMLDRTGSTSSFVQARSVFQNAEKNHKKMEYLFKEGAVSESQFDAARTEYEVSQANFDAARKLVDIRTPIAGTVTSIGVSAGDYLHPGQQVATVAAIDRLRMKLGVSSTDIRFFDVGGEVRVSVESASELVAEGAVATVARSADPVTRTFQVEIEIDNDSRNLMPGMFAKADIIMEKFEDIIVIPRSAAVSRDNKDIVYLVSGGVSILRSVVLGVEFDGSVEVKSGLSPGDTLITVGQNYLDDGFKVKLVQLVDESGKETEL